MKIMALVLPLILSGCISPGLKSEWVKVHEHEQFKLYVYPSSFYKTYPNEAMMRSMVDYNSVQDFAGTKYLSAKFRHSYDCEKERWQRCNLRLYSKNMGYGEKVGENNVSTNWEPIGPKSTGKLLWAIVCKMFHRKYEN